MPDRESFSQATSTPAGWFTTTHWNVVLAAKRGDSPQAEDALERLCCAYRPPLLAYLRREWHDATAAEDLVQEFFLRLQTKEWLGDLQHPGLDELFACVTRWGL